jgi:hypothetical protein
MYKIYAQIGTNTNRQTSPTGARLQRVPIFI